MFRIAMIKDGIVDNVAVWAGETQWYNTMQAQGYLLIDVSNIVCGPGYLYANGVFSAPPTEGF